MENSGDCVSDWKYCTDRVFIPLLQAGLFIIFVKFLTGQNADLGFEKMITTPSVNVGYLLITVVITFVILSFRLQGGLERITKYMMSALLVLMLVLAIHSFTLSGAKDGLAFYLIPDFSKISGTMIVKSNESGVFHVVGRYGRHGDLWKLTSGKSVPFGENP